MLWLSLRTMPPYLPPTFPFLPSNTSKDLLYQILPFTDRASFFLPDFLASLVPAFIASFLPCFLPFFLPSLRPSFLSSFLSFPPLWIYFVWCNFCSCDATLCSYWCKSIFLDASPCFCGVLKSFLRRAFTKTMHSVIPIFRCCPQMQS